MEELKKCNTCGKDIDGEYDYCPHCGAALKPICKRCGEPIVDGARYCIKCGKK